MSFQGKVVLVTGASSGIGAAIAILFSKEGANVAMVGRNQAKLDNVAKQCATPPFVINADITKETEGKRIVEDTVKKYGKLDVLVNNAGITKLGATIMNGKMLQTYDDIMHVNVRAVINITSAAAPHLAKTKGNIINISSTASVMVGSLEHLAYCMSKSCLDHFTKGVAVELAAYGIRVNSVNPGPVYSDMLENAEVTAYSFDAFKDKTLLKRISDPQEIADIVVFLASDKAKGITGSIYISDNGMALSNIINISSKVAVIVPSLSERLPYCMSKSSLDHFTKGVAEELAAHGIRVNSVNPGPVYTDFLENAGVIAYSYDALQDR